MISLRQHLFSLIAVFVALAVGIAAGSTVVRGPLLDSTRARLESAEEVIAAERAQNELLAAEVAQLDGWAVEGPEQLLAEQLDGRTVLMVAAGDVDSDVVAGMIRSVRSAGGSLIGEVRIDTVVFEPESTDRLVDVLDSVPVDAAARTPSLAPSGCLPCVLAASRPAPAFHLSLFARLQRTEKVQCLKKRSPLP